MPENFSGDFFDSHCSRHDHYSFICASQPLHVSASDQQHGQHASGSCA